MSVTKTYEYHREETKLPQLWEGKGERGGGWGRDGFCFDEQKSLSFFFSGKMDKEASWINIHRLGVIG